MTQVSTPAATDSRGSHSPPSRQRRDGTGRLVAVLVSPTLIVLLLVAGYPLLSAVRESLFISGQELGVDANGFVIQGDQFVGLKNYTDALTGSAAAHFWNAFWNTNQFMLITIVLETVIGMAMALVMHRAFRGRSVVRASILVPWAIPTAASALLWRWI